MTQHETAVAWRLSICNWMLIAAMALALLAALALSGFSLKAQGAYLPFGVAALYAGVAYRNAFTPRLYDPRVIFAVASTAQLVLIVALMTPLTYVAAAADLPLQDAHLVMLDRALGLDWPGYLAFFNARPQLMGYLALGYSMIAWPVLGLPVVLGLTGRYERLQRFTLAFALALIATAAISALVPAVGAFYGHGLAPDAFAHITPGGYLDQMRDFPGVRDGSLRELDIVHLVGIIMFPSFHAAAAVLFLWAFWGVWWMRPLALLSNGLMLIATPVGGGHYFIDVIAGVAVAGLAIAAANAVAARLRRPVQQPMLLLSPGAVPADRAASRPLCHVSRASDRRYRRRFRRFFEEKGRNPATRVGSPLRRYGARVNIPATGRVVARVRGTT